MPSPEPFGRYEIYLSVSTNFDGYFKIILPADFKNNIVLNFKMVGYQNKQIQLPYKTSYEFMYVKMEELELILEGEVIVIEKPTRWQRFKSWFKRKE